MYLILIKDIDNNETFYNEIRKQLTFFIENTLSLILFERRCNHYAFLGYFPDDLMLT